MQQNHAEGSVRHAEKRRRGTCQFSNRIARASLDAYARAVPQSYREASKQNCVAAIVAHFNINGGEIDGSSTTDSTAFNSNGHGDDDEDNDNSNSHLQVIGLGVGTKFLPDAIIREEQQLGLGTSDDNNDSDESYGKRIRDCHAEVLARRAFRRQVALEIQTDLNSGNMKANKDGKVGDFSADAGYVPILERVEPSDQKVDDENNNLPDTANTCYRLKPGVTLHFYASSAPCGNAVLKKFTKMEKEKFDASLEPDKWPEQIHSPIGAHSLRLGQFALLVKKDSSIPQSTPDDNTDFPEKQPLQEGSGEREKKRRKKPWPCRENDNWCPPSCSITNFNKGTMHSCSDKICRWNCLGMQGSLLMPVLDRPLLMTTLTVGRKFSRAICQRAVCCRADGFGSVAKSKAGDGMEVETIGKYKLNHPVLMETNVYMDETGTHDMTGVTSLGQDATFDSTLCWAWWPTKSSEFGYAADCLDGKTGFKINYHDSADLNKENATTQPGCSGCSTFALFQLHTEILQNSGISGMAEWKSQPKLTLPDVRQLKCQVSAQYESVKTGLFRHRVFQQWTCRDCRQDRVEFKIANTFK